MIFKKTEQEINEEIFAKKSVKDNTPVCTHYIMTKAGQKLDIDRLPLTLIAGYILKHPEEGFEILNYTSLSQRIRSFGELKELLALKQKYNPGLVMDIIGGLGGNYYLQNAYVIADYLKRAQGLNPTPDDIITQMSDIELREKSKKEKAQETGVTV